MKVINADLGAFLKRTGTKVVCWYQEDAGKFCVSVDGYLSSSKYLDAAMENAAEDSRRRENRMEAVRDPVAATTPKSAPATTTSSTAPAYVPPFQTSPSIRQAAQQAYQQQAVAPVLCPNCSTPPITSCPINGGHYHACFYGHTWATTP